MSLMGNVIETVRSTGSNYWAAYIGGEKPKTDGLNRMWTRYTSLLSRKTEFMKKQSARESDSKLTAFPVKMPH